MRKLLLLVLICLLSSCTVKRGTINSYVEPTYQPGAIQSIAIFPVMNARFAPSEARQINRKISMGLVELNPNIKIISPSESQRLINKHNLADEWATFVDDYFTSGIPNREMLVKVSEKLGADGILQGQILKTHQADKYGYSPANSRVTVTFSIVEAETAKTIWEATADGSVVDSGNSMAPTIDAAIEPALEKIIDNMPKL